MNRFFSPKNKALNFCSPIVKILEKSSKILKYRLAFMDTIEPRVVVLEHHRYSCMQFMYVFVEYDIYLTSVTPGAYVKCLPNIAISCHQSTSGN